MKFESNVGLNINGGGTRGYFCHAYLRNILNHLELDSSKVYNLYDVIGGTSIGGLLACAYAVGIPFNTIDDIFKKNAKWIFTVRTALDVTLRRSASVPSNKVSVDSKQGKALIASNQAIYQTASGYSNYGHKRLYKELKNIFGDKTINDLKTIVAIPTLDYVNKKFYLYSNAGKGKYDKYLKNDDIKLTDLLAMTSAAPCFLPPYKYNGTLYDDGGLFLNNASSCVEIIMDVINPYNPKKIMTELCTGSSDGAFYYTGDYDIPDSEKKDRAKQSLLTKLLGQEYLQLSMTGAQEIIEHMYTFKSKFSDKQFYYHGFHPALEKDPYNEGGGVDYTLLDASTSKFFDYADEIALKYFNLNKKEIELHFKRIERAKRSY